MSKKKDIVLKENGVRQRADTGLTQEIANTLVEMIFSGKRLYAKEGFINIRLKGEEEGEKDYRLSTATLNQWLTRRNVIPETGETLKALLDKTREEYGIKKREELHKQLIKDAERVFKRNLDLRTSVALRDRSGKIKKDPDTDQPLRYESHRLLKIKTETAKFVAERLDSDKYAVHTKNENKNLNFSLADLRKEQKTSEIEEVDII